MHNKYEIPLYNETLHEFEDCNTCLISSFNMKIAVNIRLWGLIPGLSPQEAFLFALGKNVFVLLLTCPSLWDYRMPFHPRGFVKRRLREGVLMYMQ